MLSNHPGNAKRQNGSGKKQQPGKSGASTGMLVLLEKLFVNYPHFI